MISIDFGLNRSSNSPREVLALFVSSTQSMTHPAARYRPHSERPPTSELPHRIEAHTKLTGGFGWKSAPSMSS
jgi:hypothetical protein